MKKLLLVVPLLFVVNTLFSQSKEVKVSFVDKNLALAIKDAEKSDKMVFLNFSASWCAPCKAMRANVYTDNEVGEFMNSKFVSLYIDGEAAEWVNTTKQFRIEGYPTMIILDAKGKEKGRIVGGQGKEQFISRVSALIDDRRSPEALARRYKEGERTPELINEYAMNIMRSNNEKEGYKIINSYFNSLSKEEKALKDNWFLFTTFSVNYENLTSRYLIDNYKDFYPTIGKEIVDEEVYRLLRLESCGHLSGYLVDNGRFDQQEYNRIKADIERVDIAKKGYLLASLRVSDARIKCGMNEGDNFASFMKMAKREFNNLEQRDCMIMVSNFQNITLKASTKVKRDAIELIEKYKTTYNYKPSNPKYDLLAKGIKILTPVDRGEMIDFKDISFDEALALAKRRGKPIFIDCYTTWCGPCKVLSEQVFTVAKIKKYFDKNFINLKIDMEKGEGPALGKRFKVRSFPTLLVINGDGEVIDVKTGVMGFEEFYNHYTQLMR